VSPYLRLVRAGALLSPAADVVAGLCLSGASWSPGAVRTMLASACIYAAGMALNDFADREEDAVSRPERPIPRGEISPRAALGTGLSLLAAGILLSALPAWHALLAVLVLGYDFVAKRNAASAVVVMGSLRALNLLAGVLLGAGPLAASLVPALAYGLMVAGITALGHEEDRAAPTEARVRFLLAAVPAAGVVGVASAEKIGLATALAAGLAAASVVAWRGRGPLDARAIRGRMLWLLLGLMLYAALLCLAKDRIPEAVGIALAVPVARWIARRIAPT
jgi:4-hydroxybenzoate polyprenyltransferase